LDLRAILFVRLTRLLQLDSQSEILEHKIDKIASQ